MFYNIYLKPIIRTKSMTDFIANKDVQNEDRMDKRESTANGNLAKI